MVITGTCLTPVPVFARDSVKMDFGEFGVLEVGFVRLLGISVRTLQKWEQGEREPSGAAKSLIRIAQRHPEVLADAMK